ncbi:MAG: hypothetical protein QOG04_1842 [Actinomycetota bacterium]|jgi:hypothetical protein|nr:hypothetical protein [Actinomycetota bacterium]
MSLEVSIAPAGEDEALGFALDGVFSLPDASGDLPEADLEYTQRSGGEAVSARFASDGETIFVEVDGERRELSPDEIEGFRATGDDSADSVFGALEVDRWIPDPQTDESGDEITVSGDLDVIAALNDIFEVARSFGGASLATIEGDEADVVRESVRSATAEITSGAEDGLLHHLVVEIDFGVADEDVAQALGPLAGAVFTLDLTISNVNEAVDVK